jgi:integrase
LVFFENNIIPFPSRRRRDDAAPTFQELAEEWLRVEGARLAAPENERRHVEHLRLLWPLTEVELRPARAREALLALLRPLGPLGPATVNKVRGTGRRIIREAQLNERWHGPNPFDVVRRLRQPRPSHRTLSIAEVRALLPHMRADRRREALVMLYLGPRPGEWKALRKVDVDLARGALTIRRSNARDATKTGRVRTVPIPAGLRPVLEEALRETPPTCELVFPRPCGRRQRADAKLSRMLQHCLRKAGLVTGYEYACRRKGCGHREERRELEPLRCPACNFKLWATGIPLSVRFYDLRHSAATLHREAGCDPLVIQLVLGHAAENLTDSLYTHLSLEYMQREIDKLPI